MITTANLDVNAQLSVHFTGGSPTNAGRVSFSPSVFKQTLDASANVFCKRITFGDLNLSVGVHYFKLLSDAFETIELSTAGTAENIVGDVIDVFEVAQLIYIQSNATAVIDAPMDIPAEIEGNGVLLIKSPVSITLGGPNDPILSLGWSAAAITAVGSGNFYCDLIFASA